MGNKPFPFSVCKECCASGETADLKEVNEKIENLETELDNRIKYVKLGACKQEIPTELDNLTNTGIYHLDWYDDVSDGSTELSESTKGFTALMIIDNSENFLDVVQTLFFEGRTLKRSGRYKYTLNSSGWQWTSWEEFSKSYVDNKISEEINKTEEKTKTLYSNALKGKATGEIIRIDDVSPVEHTANVKLSSDTITDFSNVKLLKYGKNLFGINDCKIETVNLASKEVDGNNYILKGNYGGSDLAYSTGVLNIKFSKPFKIATSMRISIYVTLIEQGERSNKIQMMEGNVRATTVLSLNVGERKKVTLNINYPTSFTHFAALIFYLNNNKVLFELDTLQIEYGSNYTEFEECVKEEYSVNADGTVDGVIMNYPTTTLFADTEGVTINAEYNQDANKTIEKLTNAIIALGGNI